MTSYHGVVTACLLAIFSQACSKGSKTPDYQSQNIFGKDQREPITSQATPWSAIGKLDSGCSGTLVGRRLMLTAAHCIVEEASQKIRSNLTYFRPNYINRQSRHQAFIKHIWLGTMKPESELDRDWAMVLLDQPLGEQIKWLDTVDLDFSKETLPFVTSLAGYSADKHRGETASVHRDCAIRQQQNKLLLHDCDAAAGVSGGPLLNMIAGKVQIVGIAISELTEAHGTSTQQPEYSPNHANIAIPASEFSATLNQLRQTVDRGQKPPQLQGIIDLPNPNKAPLETPSEPEDTGRSTDPVQPPQSSPPAAETVVQPAIFLQNAPRIAEAAELLLRELDEFALIAEQYKAEDLLQLTTTVFRRCVGLIDLAAAVYSQPTDPLLLTDFLENLYPKLVASGQDLDVSAQKFLSAQRDPEQRLVLLLQRIKQRYAEINQLMNQN